MARKVVALLSGGLDSTAMIYYLRDQGYEVLPISIHYGQRHHKELSAARKVSSRGVFQHQEISLSPLHLVLGGSSQTDLMVEVPEGHYAEDNMKVTVVPNRNMILLSIATAYAISQKAEEVAYAAHAGDHAQYPDCRQDFIRAMGAAIYLCDYDPPRLAAPFADMSKADVVRVGTQHHAPFELTWSCYKGDEHHCGRCGTCVERAEAFYLAGVQDPTWYEDANYWKEVCGLKESSASPK